MELTMENVVQYTEYMFREYYHLNTEPFFSVLDTDVMWIGPGNIFVFGKIALKSYFKDGFIMPRIDMENIEFYPLQAGRDSCIVVGRFSAHTGQDTDKVAAAYQRVTVHFRQSDKNKIVKITHLHVSNEWNELMEDEVFPVRVSVQTYRYVQKLVAESSVKKRHKKIELCNDTGLQYIDSDMVVYMEAIGKHTVVHFVDKRDDQTDYWRGSTPVPGKFLQAASGISGELRVYFLCGTLSHYHGYRHDNPNSRKTIFRGAGANC